MDKRIAETGDSSGFETTVETNRSLLPKKEIDDDEQPGAWPSGLKGHIQNPLVSSTIHFENGGECT